MNTSNTAERHLNVAMRARAGARGEVLRLLQEMMAASRAEEGNLYYSVLSDPEDPDAFYIMDGWADTAAHSAHHHSEMVARIVGELGPLLDGGVDVRLGAPVEAA